jgi:nucleotide-binding universal stress UspA family protein
MFDVIVVGTDGSETASYAVAKATDLANTCGATLHIVHAHRLVSAAQMASAATAGAPTFDIDNVNRGIEQQSGLVLEQAAQQAAAAGVKCETHAISGDAADVLVDLASQVGAELIVIGNRGMSGIRRILGSVPNKVAHHCTCSLLIVDTIHQA